MRIQQIISGKLIAITVILASIVLTFAFVVTTIKSWEFKNPNNQEGNRVAGMDQDSDDTPLPSTSTSTPKAVPSPTTRIGTPSPAEIQIPVSGSSEAYIIEVLHIENGAQSLIKIYLPGFAEGIFSAEIEAAWSLYDYACVFLEEIKDVLHCYGERLPTISQALIKVYRANGEEETRELIFSGEFAVPEFVPPPTRTPSSPSYPQPSITPTFTDFPEITPIVTLQNTPTPKPTHTPRPTRTPKPTKTPRN